MPRLRRISGATLVAVFKRFGFEVVASRGSHAKLRRYVGTSKQTITVPLHDELDTGTLRAILRQASAYIPEAELMPHFRAD
jgi:predicted RNA binding protein YcfA (HicA-like mRNA interferase family)